MRNTKFTTKTEYLQYRKDWKDEYMILSQTIRDHKLIQRYCNQDCNKATQMVGGILDHSNIGVYFRYVNQTHKENQKLQDLLLKHKNSRKSLTIYRKEATLMLEELANSKKEANLKSQRQHLETKHLQTVV